MRTVGKWALSVLLVTAAVYFGIGGWLVSSAILSIVSVDGPLSRLETQDTDPYALNYDGNPQRALGFDFEDVFLDGELGPLPAWVVHGKDASGDWWMIYAHGIAGRRESGYKALSVAQPLGITSLLLSYRNDHGAPPAPEGVYGFGITEWRDLEAAVLYAQDHGAKRIILAGDSMGGAIIGQFLARSSHVDEVVAAALDAPALEFAEIVRGLSQRAGFIVMPGMVASTARFILPWRADINFTDASTLNTFASIPGHLFVAHGKNDSVVPISSVGKLVNRRGSRGNMSLLLTEADHVLSWQENPERYRAELNAFLRHAMNDG